MSLLQTTKCYTHGEIHVCMSNRPIDWKLWSLLFLALMITSISFYKKLGLRFAYINLNVKESDCTPISSWFM